MNKNSINYTDWNDWHWQINNSYKGLSGIKQLVDFDPETEVKMKLLINRYPFCVTPYYLSIADIKDSCNPVGIQCVPDLCELEESKEQFDPFRELENMPVPGLIHRFRDRVLVIASNKCAVYCRHCTRKNILKKMESNCSKNYFEQILNYISGTNAIREVIISGGDPLLTDFSLLDWLLGSVKAIKHIEVIRIGTRVPVVLPMRIDKELCEMLASHRPLWINTQFNHPVEITSEAIQAVELLLKQGIPVSNQSVLLRGVNDSVEIMRELCNTLQRNMIRPYYVFQCDPVRGIKHLRVDPCIGANIAEELRKTTGGLSLPAFVADVPGERGKVPLIRILQESKKKQVSPHILDSCNLRVNCCMF